MEIPASPCLLPSSQTVIRFQDCDPFGHLRNPKYIEYFLNAREDHLAEHYGLLWFGADGHAPQRSWVVSETHITYLVPAMPMETVCIQTSLLEFTKRSLVVEAQMLDKTATQLKALAWVGFTYVEVSSGRPAVHEDALLQLLSSIHVPVPGDPQDFQGRVDAVRKVLRSARSGSA